jgi:hypothetical protein
MKETSFKHAIEDVIAHQDPTLDADKLKEGVNVLKEKDGTKVVLVVSERAEPRLIATLPDGREATTFQIHPAPPSPHPLHVKVCACVPYSTAYGEGIDCWWVPIEITPHKR